MIGQTLAHYRITAKLGAGGMGEVYRARDSKLDRDVALKLLPADMVRDPERQARFQREARTLASLHHPNIASIFGYEQDGEHRFLVMELVEGEDLSVRLERGAFPMESAIAITRQIAEGLEAAHAKGIVHRDLKPANIKLDPEGRVKILDFGLARAYTGDGQEDSDLSQSPTITAAMTQAGTILGTAAYMSPEQARGRAADQRADVWALGVILYEMVTGQRLFAGETISDTLAAVLRADPDFAQLPAQTPDNVRRVLRRCLQRDRTDRLHSAADVRIELDDATASSESGRAAPQARASWLPWLLAAGLAITAGVLSLRPNTAPPEQNWELDLALPAGHTLNILDWQTVAIAPNASAIAALTLQDGKPSLWVRKTDSTEWKQVRDSSGAEGPFFSPDGKWIGFLSSGAVYKAAIDGGAAIRLADASKDRGASWSDDGWIYFSPSYASGLLRVPASGGEVDTVTVVDAQRSERTHRWPCALPQGRGVVFTIGTPDAVSDYENADLAVWDAHSDEVRRLGIKGAMARYSRTGHLLVMRNQTLHAVRFDLEGLAVSGDPIPVRDGIEGDASSGAYYFDVTNGGHLLYSPTRRAKPQRTLVWFDRDGKRDPLPLPPGPYRYPNLSPDGSSVVLVMGENTGNEDDVYVIDLGTMLLSRLTFAGTCLSPLFDTSGRQVIYGDVGKGTVEIQPIDGSRPSRSIRRSSDPWLPSSISPDGSRILGTRLGATTLSDIYSISSSDSTLFAPLIASQAEEFAAQISPDGRFVAYSSDESGREEIYVQRYPTTGAKWQVSANGGRGARWSPDGTELFFTIGNTLLSAPIRIEGDVFRSGVPSALFNARFDSGGTPIPPFVVMPGGTRFLAVINDDTSDVTNLVLSLGWADRLRDVE